MFLWIRYGQIVMVCDGLRKDIWNIKPGPIVREHLRPAPETLQLLMWDRGVVPFRWGEATQGPRCDGPHGAVGQEAKPILSLSNAHKIDEVNP